MQSSATMDCDAYAYESTVKSTYLISLLCHFALCYHRPAVIEITRQHTDYYHSTYCHRLVNMYESTVALNVKRLMSHCGLAVSTPLQITCSMTDNIMLHAGTLWPSVLLHSTCYI